MHPLHQRARNASSLRSRSIESFVYQKDFCKSSLLLQKKPFHRNSGKNCDKALFLEGKISLHQGTISTLFIGRFPIAFHYWRHLCASRNDEGHVNSLLIVHQRISICEGNFLFQETITTDKGSENAEFKIMGNVYIWFWWTSILCIKVP